jgi:hypothetical protein
MFALSLEIRRLRRAAPHPLITTPTNNMLAVAGSGTLSGVTDPVPAP